MNEMEKFLNLVEEGKLNRHLPLMFYSGNEHLNPFETVKSTANLVKWGKFWTYFPLIFTLYSFAVTIAVGDRHAPIVYGVAIIATLINYMGCHQTIRDGDKMVTIFLDEFDRLCEILNLSKENGTSGLTIKDLRDKAKKFVIDETKKYFQEGGDEKLLINEVTHLFRFKLLSADDLPKGWETPENYQ